jgi:hypothetical protein
VREVGQCQVEEKQDYQSDQVQQGWRLGGGENDFDQGEERV